MKHPLLRALWMLPLLLPMGCATTVMRGTPFYSGEYAQTASNATERVNLWPLAYYNDPALSIVWPLCEYVRGDHFALRPLYSMYNLNRPDEREWNILWPIMQQDNHTGDGRVFPIFWWGEDYFTGFPLYWHGSRADGGYDVLFPLWWYSREGDHRFLATLLGLAGFEEGGGFSSWWLAPLAGSFNADDGSHYRYLLWPLIHESKSARRQWSAILPFWYQSESAESWRRMALALWWQGGKANGDEWQMLLPLYWRRSGGDVNSFFTLLGGWSEEGNKSTWIAPVLLAGGFANDDEFAAYLFGGLARWSGGKKPGPTYVFPLFYQNPRAGLFISPVYYASATADGLSAFIPPLLSGFNSGPERTEVWSLGGLYAHEHRSDDSDSDWLLPLYAWDEDLYFYTPLFGYNHDGFRYFLTPMISAWDNDQESGFRVFPLLSRSTKATGETRTRFLWGSTTTRSNYTRSIFFPLYGYTDFGPIQTNVTQKRSSQAGTDFFCIPYCWYENTASTGAGSETTRTYTHGVFPLWSYEEITQPDQTKTEDASFLVLLYNHASQTGPDTTRNYTRHSVLWRVWHYYETDEATRIDALPGITWDSNTKGYRQFSLLWRLFRWQKKEDGATSVDFLFLPVYRGSAKPPAR